MSHTIKDDFSEDEDLIQNIIEVIRYEHKATISLFQRRFRIGYPRATAIMRELVKRGIVAPVDDEKNGGARHDILIELKELEQSKPALSHTKEPWPEPSSTSNKCSPWRIYAIASFDNHTDAARAVTCVNACAGMADPEAEIRNMMECLVEIALGGCEGDQEELCSDAPLNKEDWCIPCKCNAALKSPNTP